MNRLKVGDVIDNKVLVRILVYHRDLLEFPETSKGYTYDYIFTEEKIVYVTFFENNLTYDKILTINSETKELIFI